MKPLCSQCDQPATRRAFHQDWCEECLSHVEAEMNEFSDSKPALSDEEIRLMELQRKRKVGHPSEL